MAIKQKRKSRNDIWKQLDRIKGLAVDMEIRDRNFTGKSKQWDRYKKASKIAEKYMNNMESTPEHEEALSNYRKFAHFGDKKFPKSVYTGQSRTQSFNTAAVGVSKPQSEHNKRYRSIRAALGMSAG